VIFGEFSIPKKGLVVSFYTALGVLVQSSAGLFYYKYSKP
jgi:hypothetical protein